MKKSFILVITVSLIIYSCNNGSNKKQSTDSTKNVEQTKKLLADGKLRYLELYGSPYQRGLNHGKLLKNEIQEVIELFKADIKETTKVDSDQYISTFLNQTDYKTTIIENTPDLMEELKGISTGAGIDFDIIFMFQLIDEFWFNSDEIHIHKCSSLGINKISGQPGLAGQNMDIPSFFHGYQTVIKIVDTKSDIEMMLLTIPGHLGLTGMNNKSVSINCNTLMQLDYGKTGLPVTFIVREIVEKHTQEEALNFLNNIKHASGQNYIIGGPNEVLSLECSANKVALFRPFENSPFTYHTNHPIVNDDYSQKYLNYFTEETISIEQYKKLGFGCQRIKLFQEKLNEETKSLDLIEIKNILRSRDNETGDVISNENTYSSVIYILSNNPRFLVTPGKPHEQDYIELDFIKQ